MKTYFIGFCLLIISGLLIFSAFKNSDKTDNKERLMDTINENVRTVLKKYKVTGFSFIDFTIDPNLACIKETQNPEFNVYYQDKTENIKFRRYKAEINTIGLKLEASIKFDFIFFINTDINFYDSDKVIELGKGIDSNFSFFSGIAFTYAPFKNCKGAMLIVSVPILFVGPSLSLVTGGSLTPVL